MAMHPTDSRFPYYGTCLESRHQELSIRAERDSVDICPATQWRTVGLAVFVAHLPIAVVEGIVLGFTVGFLAKVKPEMLGLDELAPPSRAPTAQPECVRVESAAAYARTEKLPCHADPLP